MKSACSILIIGFFFIKVVLFSGCNDNSSQQESLTAPDKQQLERSNFAQFVNKLESLPLAQRMTAVQNFLNDYPNSPVVEENGLACFYWFGNASEVLINGDIQSGWSNPEAMNIVSCGKEKFYYKIYQLPDDARVDYQFIIDGGKITDPRNPFTTQSGYGLNSQCAMPLFKTKKIRQYRPGINHGSIDSVFFESRLTSMKPRMLKIYKPAGYSLPRLSRKDESGDSLSALPAVYVNDGFKAIEFCSYLNILDNLIADKKIKPLLVVFIDFVEDYQNIFLNRTNDYSIAVCDELVSFIDANYSTSKNPRDRLLTGISAGGHAALVTALKRSDVFLNAAGQSSAITAGLIDAVNNAAANPEAGKSLKLYFDIGRFDLAAGDYKNYPFLYANQLLSEELNKAGITHKFKIVNDGHQWANWRERIDEILIYFFGI